MKLGKKSIFVICLLTSLLTVLSLLAGLEALGSTKELDNYDIVLPGAEPPMQRAAPYGQYIVSHNAVAITLTANSGTVMRTNGYGDLKAVICDVGANPITATLQGRVTSTGSVYTMTSNMVFLADHQMIYTTTQIAPWMTLKVYSNDAGGTNTCGLYVQTP